MSQTFLDRGQLVGYDFENKTLIATMTKKTAMKMIADGWEIGHEETVGYFLSVKLPEEGGDSEQEQRPSGDGSANNHDGG